jgi:coenzyme F420-0:L-glutamate ligase/coenzyme F420-1:gamma-L-glutamate ligase
VSLGVSAGPLAITPVAGLPEIGAGDDLAAMIAASLPRADALADGDVVVIAHKAVSKAEGRVRALAEVTPTTRAQELAAAHDKDARHVQVVLDEAAGGLRRAERGILIAVTRHGYVCANAGVDASNAAGEGTVIMLPLDPDGTARALRARLHELTGAAVGVIITDTFGRAWRRGQADVAIGCAGVTPLDEWRGRLDATGRELKATSIAIADELAAAADLARRKDSSIPVVIVRGAAEFVTADDGPGAAAIVRPEHEDLFP